MFWEYILAIVLSLMYVGCGIYIILYLLWLNFDTEQNKRH